MGRALWLVRRGSTLPGKRFLAMLALCIHLASAALPPGAKIDVESIAALSASQDVCVDTAAP